MLSRKEIRASTSCTECQRRKQKCSREWPCSHCHTRKVPHLCQSGHKRAQRDSDPGSSREPASQRQGQKRSHPGSTGSTESTEASSWSQERLDEEPEDGLKAWGYMPGHVHYHLTLGRHSFRPDRPGKLSGDASAVEQVLAVIPPRSLTDAFVNHFLDVVNYRYNIIHGPTLTDQYVQWWSDRANDKPLSPEFTCLLLRVCAYSVQYLTPQLRNTVEFELACDSQKLTRRFAAAAEELSKSFSASKTCLERVQEQFMKAAWLKSESRIVEAWHTLGCSIREAQELGLDKEPDTENLTEFELEIRKRVWTLLYVWDWQMSAWLGRPHLIDQKTLSFQFPSLRLDQSLAVPNHISPFTHILLQAQIARRISQSRGDTQSPKELSPDTVLSVQDECDKFITELPAVFRMDSPDLSLDEQYPHFVFQRFQLHAVLHMAKLDPLKRYLTSNPRSPDSQFDKILRAKGVNTGLQLLELTRQLFNHEFPINAKFHLVVFCLFDTATVFCSAVIHDIDRVLPRRNEVMSAVEGALAMLHQLSLTTEIGASSYMFLFRLVQAVPVLSRYLPLQKRPRTGVPPSNPPPAHNFRETENRIADTTMAPILDVPTTDDISFDLDDFSVQNLFANSSQLDIGRLEQIWDWDDLNLDSFSNQDPPA